MTDLPIHIDTAIAAASSPLGRYDPSAGPADGPPCEVRMLAVPVDLFLASRQQHDDLVREFAVMGLAHEDADPREPAGLRELVRELGVHYARSTVRTYEEFEAARRNGSERIDLVFTSRRLW